MTGRDLVGQDGDGPYVSRGAYGVTGGARRGGAHADRDMGGLLTMERETEAARMLADIRAARALRGYLAGNHGVEADLRTIPVAQEGVPTRWRSSVSRGDRS